MIKVLFRVLNLKVSDQFLCHSGIIVVFTTIWTIFAHSEFNGWLATVANNRVIIIWLLDAEILNQKVIKPYTMYNYRSHHMKYN